jgi:DNA modification methylase
VEADKFSRRIKIEYVPIKMVSEWDGNPRVIGDEQYRALTENLRKFGIVDPLIVDQHNRIVGGHQRLKALKAMGVKEVPIVKLSLTSNEFKVLNVALNRISGEWDNGKLAPILAELAPLPELRFTGFSPQEANYVIETFSQEVKDACEDFAPSRPKKASTELGTLYALGEHRLLCDDATDPMAWKKLLGDWKAGMVFMDPPYGVGYDLHSKFVLDRASGEARHHKSWGVITNDDDTEAATESLPNVFGNLADDGVTYITCGTRLLLRLANWLDTNHVRYGSFLIWDKGAPVITWERYHAEHEFIIYCGPGSYPTRGKGGIKSRWFGPKNETTLWRIPREPNAERTHPTQKPVALYERAIANSSSRGELVVDPFAGSGTCLIAAEKHGRRAYCVELDPKYCDVAVSRWETYTHRKARRLN